MVGQMEASRADKNTKKTADQPEQLTLQTFWEKLLAM
jgi:hypothetical protein